MKKENEMEVNINLLDKPCLTINEAVMVLNLSNQSIRRRVAEGRLKAVARHSDREKILIFTKSIIKYLNNDSHTD